MIDLARKLSDCDEKYFGGWVLAGVEIKLQGKAETLENSVLLAKERRCVHEARGYDASGRLVQSLRLFLVIPKSISMAKVQEKVVPEGRLVYSHAFDSSEIEAYIAYTGDKNIIHKGEHPLVPGICMLYALQRFLQLKELDWKVSFLAPVYAGDEFQVFQTETGFTAYANQKQAFVVKI